MDGKGIVISELKNGNVVFSYKHVTYKRNSMWIFIPLIIVLILCIYEYTHNESVYILMIGVPIILYFFYRWLKKTENKNKRTEEEIIYNALNPVIIKDINFSFGENVVEVEREYIIKTGKYGEVVEKHVTVLLSNGKELKYQIINGKYYDKIRQFEIDMHPIVEPK